MSQRKEKYARRMEFRVDKLEREVSSAATAVKVAGCNIEGLREDLAVYKAAQRRRQEREEAQRLSEHRLQCQRDRLAREDRRRRIILMVFMAIVAGLAIGLLTAPVVAESQSVELPVQGAAAMVAEHDVPYIFEPLNVAPVEGDVPEEPGRYAVITEEEKELLARLIWLEARGEPAVGQQAVAEVVLNRVAADNFPDTVREVIFEGWGTDCPQFSTAGMIEQAEPTAEQYEAVERALRGEDILPMDVVFFSRKGENDRVWGTIGGHVFCYQYVWA